MRPRQIRRERRPLPAVFRKRKSRRAFRRPRGRRGSRSRPGDGNRGGRPDGRYRRRWFPGRPGRGRRLERELDGFRRIGLRRGTRGRTGRLGRRRGRLGCLAPALQPGRYFGTLTAAQQQHHGDGPCHGAEARIHSEITGHRRHQPLLIKPANGPRRPRNRPSRGWPLSPPPSAIPVTLPFVRSAF